MGVRKQRPSKWLPAGAHTAGSHGAQQEASGSLYRAEPYHQQYLSGSRNPGGYCGLDGTGVKLSTPFETNWGASCPTGLAPAPTDD